MAVVFGLEGFNKNDVGVDVIGEHCVVVAAAGADGEAAHVVGVELGDGFDADVEFIGGWGGGGIRGIRWGRTCGGRGNGEWPCDLGVGTGRCWGGWWSAAAAAAWLWWSARPFGFVLCAPGVSRRGQGSILMRW